MELFENVLQTGGSCRPYVLVWTKPYTTGTDLGGGCRGAHPPEMSCGFLIHLVLTSVH